MVLDHISAFVAINDLSQEHMVKLIHINVLNARISLFALFLLFKYISV